MPCRDIKKSILQSEGKDWTLDEHLAVQSHIKQCQKCAGLLSDLQGFRNKLKQFDQLKPPAPLVEQTRNRCYRVIDNLQAEEMATPLKKTVASLPGFVQAAVTALIILTGFVVVPNLKDIDLSQPLSFKMILTLSLLIQNAVMLIISPILIRRYGSHGSTIHLHHINGNIEKIMSRARPRTN